MPSPICTVQDGAGAPQATTNGADVTAGNVITIPLVSTAGVNTWSLTVVGQDDLVTPPTITINNTTRTATFTAPAGPWSLVLKSVVNNGLNSAGRVDNTLTTTFKVSVKTAGGARLGATNEVLENNATFGWLPIINGLVRGGGGGGGALTAFGSDLQTSTATNQFVSSITGAGGTAATVSLGNSASFALMFLSTVTSPSLTQAQSTTGAGVNLLIQAQAAKTGSGLAGGDVVLQGGTSDGAGANTGILLKTTGGSNLGRIYPQGAQDWSFSLDSSRTNYIFKANNTASQNVYFQSGSSGVTEVDAANFNIATFNATNVWQFQTQNLQLQGVLASGSYTINQTAQGSAATNGTAFTFQAQNATGFGGYAVIAGGANTAAIATTFAATGMTGSGVSPIVVTCASTAGMYTGQLYTGSGSVGNTAANSTFVVQVLTGTTFALLGSTGNGTWTSGGTFTPVTNGGSVVLQGFTANAGAANAGAIVMLSGTTSGGTVVAVGTASGLYVPNAFQGAPLIVGDGISPTSGAIRFPYPGTGTFSYLTTHDSSTNTMPIVQVNAGTATLSLGDTITNPGLYWTNAYLTAGSAVELTTSNGGHVYLGSQSYTVLDINNSGGTALSMTFYTQNLPPVISQATTTTAATGQNMTIQAQNSTAASSTGGDLILSPGTGTTANGKLNFNNCTTSTTATAFTGGAALAVAVGFVAVKINGTNYKLVVVQP